MKTAIILGDLDRGTIQTCLQTNGYKRQTKLLKSSVKNWQSICQLLRDDEAKEVLVLGKFTEYVVFLFTLYQYQVVAKNLLELIAERPHILFIFHKNLLGEFSCASIDDRAGEILVNNENGLLDYEQAESVLHDWHNSEYGDGKWRQSLTAMIAFVKALGERGVNLSPYQKLIDIEVAGQHYIESFDQGLLFKLYVPKQRLWSNEFDKFIVMFRDFASSVTNASVTVKQSRTDRGTTFSIFSASKVLNPENLEQLFNEFTSFLDMCVQDPESAMKVLEDTTELPANTLPAVVSKYAREAKRLMIDLKHERERKLLEIKHQLETDISEVEIGVDLEQLIESRMPKLRSPSDLLAGVSHVQNQTIIVDSTLVSKAEGIIARTVSGNIDFNIQDQQLDHVIDKYAETSAEKSLLKSAHNELKDTSVPNDTKKVAWQRLQKFLGKTAEKVGDVGVNLLAKYLETQLGM